jgi:hypothetical protein
MVDTIDDDYKKIEKIYISIMSIILILFMFSFWLIFDVIKLVLFTFVLLCKYLYYLKLYEILLMLLFILLFIYLFTINYQFV